jgi:hypothetical protein
MGLLEAPHVLTSCEPMLHASATMANVVAFRLADTSLCIHAAPDELSRFVRLLLDDKLLLLQHYQLPEIATIP